MEFPDGTTPVMSRVCIYDSAVGGGVGVGAPLKIALPPQLPLGSLYMEEVHAKVKSDASDWKSSSLQSCFLKCHIDLISSLERNHADMDDPNAEDSKLCTFGGKNYCRTCCLSDVLRII